MNIITTYISFPWEQFEVTNLIGLNAPIFSYLNISLTNLALLNSIIFNHFNTSIIDSDTIIFITISLIFGPFTINSFIHFINI